MKRGLEIAALVALGLALYPVLSIGGLLDRAVGPWWTLAIFLTAVLLLSAGYSELRRRRGGA